MLFITCSLKTLYSNLLKKNKFILNIRLNVFYNTNFEFIVLHVVHLCMLPNEV